MTNINLSETKPGEVFEGTVDGERLVLFRRNSVNSYPWESLYRLYDHEDVSDLVRLVLARPATHQDLPDDPDDRWETFKSRFKEFDGYRSEAHQHSLWTVFRSGVQYAEARILDHLNANGGVPADSGDDFVPFGTGPHWKDAARRFEADADRLRRAHEIVETERDQARHERNKWEEKYLDTDEALHKARDERDQYKRSGDEWKECHADAVRERDEWKARAEAAERERDEADHLNANHQKSDAQADAEWLDRALNTPDEHLVALDEARIEANIQRNRAVRERDAAVARAWQAERERDEAWYERDRNAERSAQLLAERDEWKARADEWHGAWQKSAPARTVARDDIEKVVRRYIPSPNFSDPIADEVCNLFGIEAEQDVDPVENQTDALADILYGDYPVTDQMRGVLKRVVRAGMLFPGQEAGDE